MDINIRRYFSILLHIGLYAGKHKRIFWNINTKDNDKSCLLLKPQ
jgi:hypothetical protein